jgi:hypothetical protein
MYEGIFARDLVHIKHLWPPPHMQVECECGSDDLCPITWSSFTIVVHEAAIWNYCIFSWKPPWPSPARPYFKIMHVATVGSSNHMTVITEWSLHVLFQKEQQQQWGGTGWLVGKKDHSMVPKGVFGCGTATTGTSPGVLSCPSNSEG